MSKTELCPACADRALSHEEALDHLELEEDPLQASDSDLARVLLVLLNRRRARRIVARCQASAG